MALDYVALAQWGLVPALGVLFGITLTYSYKIFYKKIIEKENEIKNKVRSDVTEIVNQFNDITSENQQGEQEFANQIGRIAKFKEITKDSKTAFRRDIVLSAIVTILLGVVYIIWIDKRDAIFVGGIFSLGYHLLMFNSLRIDYDKLERFLNGEDPKIILGEE